MPKRKIFLLVFLLSTAGAEVWQLARSGDSIRIASRDLGCSNDASETLARARPVRPC